LQAYTQYFFAPLNLSISVYSCIKRVAHKLPTQKFRQQI
jgi:hypothetical protein